MRSSKLKAQSSREAQSSKLQTTRLSVVGFCVWNFDLFLSFDLCPLSFRDERAA
jgi:hypothetical protein